MVVLVVGGQDLVQPYLPPVRLSSGIFRESESGKADETIKYSSVPPGFFPEVDPRHRCIHDIKLFALANSYFCESRKQWEGVYVCTMYTGKTSFLWEDSAVVTRFCQSFR